MKILHVIPAVAARYGGPSTNLWPLIRALNALSGIEAEVCTTDADGPEKVLDPSSLPTDVVCHVFPRVGGEALKRSPQMFAWLSQNVKNYAAVHIHSLWNSPSNVAAFEAKRANVPYVVRPAGMLSDYTWQRGWLKKRVFWCLKVRSVVRNAAAIHVTSPEEEREAKAFAPNTLIFEAANGLEDAAFNTPIRKDWLRSQCGPAAGQKPIVLFLSRLHPKKGVADYLIPAFAKLKSSAYLAIAGGVDDTTPDYGTEIDQAINRNGLNGIAARIGTIDVHDRWAAFDGATVFCLPSENENFGSVVPEALARGCPVVTTVGVAAARYAIAAKAGIAVPRTVDAIATALIHELGQQHDREARGQRARELVRKELDWSHIAVRVAEIYQNMIFQRTSSK